MKSHLEKEKSREMYQEIDLDKIDIHAGQTILFYDKVPGVGKGF